MQISCLNQDCGVESKDKIEKIKKNYEVMRDCMMQLPYQCCGSGSGRIRIRSNCPDPTIKVIKHK